MDLERGVSSSMSGGGQVTLIFRKRDPNIMKEHIINTIASMFSKNSLTHTEIAIGCEPATDGQSISNVFRIFNDNVGVEHCERTGLSPQFFYLHVGCSKDAERKMLEIAKQQVGKPFNPKAMLRSIFWPRTTTANDFFCAELVAYILKSGGLMSQDSNPGSATPQSLFDLYGGSAALTGNPTVLNKMSRRGPKRMHITPHTPTKKHYACVQQPESDASVRRSMGYIFKNMPIRETMFVHNKTSNKMHPVR